MAVLTKITSRTLADNSVTSAKIQGDVIAATDLAPNSVTASELADDAVDTAAIADDAVTNAAIADGAIDTTAKIADDVISGAKLTNDVAISTTGNIATTGSGSITAGGVLTAAGAATLNDGIKQQASKAVTGTLTAKQMLMGDAYSLTGDLTVNNEVKLGSIAPKEDVVLMSDSTSANRTITGTGTLEIGSVSASHQTQDSDIIAAGLTADADISDALEATLHTKRIKRNCIVGFNRNRYGFRTSVSNVDDVILWPDAVVINKKYSDTMLHITGLVAGHGHSSYPFYATYVEVITPGGTTVRHHEGSWYQYTTTGANEAIHWFIDSVFTTNECNGEIGTFRFQLGWDHKNNTTGKPFTIWNPNNTDDGRGWQQYSFANAYELYGGEDGNWDNKRADQ